MPPKRKDSEDSKEGSSATSSPNKRAFKGKRPWNTDEERNFLNYIDQIVKERLWAAVKEDPELASRGGNGIRSHWDAMFKQMKKIVK